MALRPVASGEAGRTLRSAPTRSQIGSMWLRSHSGTPRSETAFRPARRACGVAPRCERRANHNAVIHPAGGATTRSRSTLVAETAARHRIASTSSSVIVVEQLGHAVAAAHGEGPQRQPARGTPQPRPRASAVSTSRPSTYPPSTYTSAESPLHRCDDLGPSAGRGRDRCGRAVAHRGWRPRSPQRRHPPRGGRRRAQHALDHDREPGAAAAASRSRPAPEVRRLLERSCGRATPVCGSLACRKIVRSHAPDRSRRCSRLASRRRACRR